jgi:peptidoglycan/xylan/chitin deacetylase (PgdA/CDA1 family)
MMKLLRASLLTLIVAGCATPQLQRNPPPEIALTVDDLPLHGPIPPGQTPVSVADGIIAALTQAHVPAYGFVNAHWVVDRPETMQVLKAWRAAGLPLGNHTWAHRHLSEMTIAQFDEEVTRDEPVLQQLGGGSDWHWFRYPFLDEGMPASKRQAARTALARHGYKIADVTMDFSDWSWTAPYARCVAANDQPAIAHLQDMYLAAAREAITYYRGLSRQLYARDIPYVVLLHDSAFEARMLPQLIQLYRSAGFRFVSLPHAERDSFYADQVEPDLPAQPEGLEDKAIARGILLPHRTDYSAELAAICPGGPTTASP